MTLRTVSSAVVVRTLTAAMRGSSRMFDCALTTAVEFRTTTGMRLMGYTVGSFAMTPGHFNAGATMASPLKALTNFWTCAGVTMTGTSAVVAASGSHQSSTPPGVRAM